MLLLFSVVLMADGQMYTQVGMWYEISPKTYEGKPTPSYAKVLEAQSPKKIDIFQLNEEVEEDNIHKVKTNLLINGTNFARGIFIPANTQVLITSIDRRFIFFKFEDKMIMAFNRDQYTKLSWSVEYSDVGIPNKDSDVF